MYSNHRAPHPAQFMRIFLFGLFAAMFLPGCGGTSKGVSAASGSRSGHVQLTIQWPAKSRSGGLSKYLPPYAASLVFQLQPVSQPETQYSLAVNRPSDLPSSQTVQFTQLLPEGDYMLAGAARADLAGQGATVATASTKIHVTAGQTATVSLTLISVIKSLTALNQPLSVSVGQSVQLVAQALDPDGKVVLLPASALHWTVQAGNGFATITTTGVITGVAAGSATIRVSEDGAGIFSDTSVTISSVPSGPGLATQSPWPKSYANAANTGQGGGQGATGVQQWQFSVGGTSVNSPAIGADGTIYIASGSADGTGSLYAADAATGTQKWVAAIGAPGGGSAAVGMNGTVYVCDQSGVVYAVNGANGAQLWKQPTGTGNFGIRLTIGSGGAVYVIGGDGSLYALDGASGAIKWMNASVSTGFGCAIGADGTIYAPGVSSSGQSPGILAINPADGSVLRALPFTNYLSAKIAIAADGTLIVSDVSTTTALNPVTGAKKWQSSLGGAPPTIGTDGTIFVSSGTAIAALNGADGTAKWQTPTSSAFFFLSIGSDNTVYGTSSGAIFAFNGATGVQKWSLSSSKSSSSQDTEPAIGADGTIYFAHSDQSNPANSLLFAVR